MQVVTRRPRPALIVVISNMPDHLPVNLSLSIQKHFKKLNYFLLEAGDKFKGQKRQFHGTFNLYNHDLTRPVIRQIRKMADYNYCWLEKKTKK